ncbi:DUF3990 domain-containing protein [Marinisporobacter balticus]|uniref:Uncharacterized protein DUF3990 n=1 Tax=Marinisporobacter balticus TaxID=2018667 RepID=A0A4R2KJB3_9FIRM|nr:DUF3990 domain-containing protein [Marinisporobacter balticus]TCO70666.1 uncharacterized protein DUF3990 [Marinisporobacter balticus]
MPSKILYHGSSDIVTEPIVRATKFHKDFGWGFYCTDIRKQAVKWAIRRSNQRGVINKYNYVENTDLKILKFEEMTDAWLDFIARCRSGNQHGYDIVEGAMADDVVWDWVSDFLEGTISRAAFWELVKFRHPTHQISFHTPRALQCLTYVDSEFITGVDNNATK